MSWFNREKEEIKVTVFKIGTFNDYIQDYLDRIPNFKNFKKVLQIEHPELHVEAKLGVGFLLYYGDLLLAYKKSLIELFEFINDPNFENEKMKAKNKVEEKRIRIEAFKKWLEQGKEEKC